MRMCRHGGKTMLKSLIGLTGCALASLAALPAAAQGTPPRMIGTLNVANLCSAVEVQAVELEPVHDTVTYQYQNLLYIAAGVSAADTEEAVNRKIRDFLNAHMPELLCNQVNFTVRNGNLLKLGVARQVDPFLFDVLEAWKPDLNQVDVADGFTVLDYIEQRGDTYKPGQTRTYETLYKRFRAAGALHRFEIAATGKPLPPVESTAQALAKLESKAQAGDFYSAMRLADIYRDGRILNGPIPPSSDRMRLWLERAGALAVAARNVSDAHWLGMTYGSLKDRAAELRWYAKAVELGGTPPKDRPPRGWFEANLELGKAYALGDGVPRNLDLALLHVTRANETAWSPGSGAIPLSQRWMGYVAELRGDRDMAARWYRTARYAAGTNDVPPGSGQSIEKWLAANGLPRCGIDIYGKKDC